MSPFARDAVERTARTVVQASAAAVLAVWISAGSWSAIDWSVIWQVALFAAGLTILTALAGAQRGSPDDASFFTEKEEGQDG